MKRHVLSVAVPVLVLAFVGGCPKKIPTGEEPGAQPSDAGVQDVASSSASQRIAGEEKCHFGVVIKNYLESKPQSPHYRGGALEYFTSFTLNPTNPELNGNLFEGWGSGNGAPTSIKVDARRGNEVCTLELKPIFPSPNEQLKSVQLYQVVYDTLDLCHEQPSDLFDLTPERQTLVKQHTGTAIAVPGYWERGTWDAGNGKQFTLSCLSGVVAKCVVWDYVPWKERENDPPGTAASFHHACVHAARAKYLQDQDSSFTCTNTPVDIFDKLGIQPKGNDTRLKLESVWGERGLVCMNHSRWQGCQGELQTAPASSNCNDPHENGGTWLENGLIAIRSSTMNSTDAGVCPSQPDAGCW